jgi:DNA-binding beta-propeller fold protein YncE
MIFNKLNLFFKPTKMTTRHLLTALAILISTCIVAQRDDDGNGISSESFDHAVSELNSETQRIAACTEVLTTLPQPSDTSQGLAYDGQHLWLASNNYIRRISTIDGSVLQTIPSNSVYPGGLAYDGNDLWMSDRDNARLIEISTDDGSILTEYYYPQFDMEGVILLGMAYEDENLWFSARYPGLDSTYKVSAATGEILDSFLAYGDISSGMAADDYFLYYANNGPNTNITIIDPVTFNSLTTFETPGGTAPNGLAYDGQYLWISENTSDLIYKVDVNAIFPTEVTDCNSYPWFKDDLTESGVYYYVTEDNDGCDQIIVLDLTILESFDLSVDYFEVCDGVEYAGEFLSESGSYSFEEVDDQGCTYNVIVTIGTVLSSSSSETQVTACNSYEWNGQEYFQSGQYTFGTLNSVGCDSTAFLDLTILEGTPDLNIDYFQVCDGVEYEGEFYTEPGSYAFEYEDDQGCPYSVSLTIGEVLMSTSSISEVTACGSYEWNGEEYFESGEYSFEAENSAGCDSTAVLLLTITEDTPDLFIDYFEVCEGVEFEGEFYDESGQYVIEFENEFGCAYTVTLTIGEVLSSSSSETQVTACGSYEWNGQEFFESGEYVYETENAAGCDSTAFLILTINEVTPDLFVDYFEVCDGVEFEGVFYDEAGAYPLEFENEFGCPYIITLTIGEVLESTSSLTEVNACGSYEWNGEVYAESGVYDFQTSNAAGCDSTAVLQLTIDEIEGGFTVNEENTILTANQSGAEYVWLSGAECGSLSVISGENSQSFDSIEADEYYVLVVSLGACTDTSECQIVLGLEDGLTVLPLGLFPNPSNGLVYLDLDERFTDDGELNVFDLRGRLLKSMTLKNLDLKRSVLDLTELANGLYTVQVRSSSVIATQSLVIEK